MVALVPIVTAAILAGAGAASARAGTAVAAQAAPAPLPAARAMWVWDTSDPAATVALAVEQGIGQLYAAVPPNVSSSPQLPQLQVLAGRAAAAGIRVDALGGDPGWIDNQTWVVNSWLRPALATGLFTGVHVDIEPYTTPAWNSRRATVVKRYLATLDTLGKVAGSIPVEADIPFWFDQIPANGSTLDREIMRRTAGVTVMAYRNLASGVDGSIALSANEIRSAGELGRTIRVGQETNFLGTDPIEVKQTFHGQTLNQMEAQLAAVRQAFATAPGFTGLAIHDFTGYAAMVP
jgi:hypothetical protein